MSVSYKEARESAYWLRLVNEAQLVPSTHLNELIDETEQLVKMLASILLTSKQSKSKSDPSNSQSNGPGVLS